MIKIQLRYAVFRDGGYFRGYAVGWFGEGLGHCICSAIAKRDQYIASLGNL